MPRHLKPKLLGLPLLLGILPCDQSHAQEPTPAVAAAWTAFQQQAPGQWLVRWHGATGTPSAIFGHGWDLDGWQQNSLTEARRHANEALRRWPGLLGLGQSEFREEIGQRMGRSWTFTFSQWFDGLPVIGGRADVRIHMKGRLSYLGSTAFDVPADFDTTPTIGEEAATAIAWQLLGTQPNAVPQPGNERRPRLVIWGDQNAPQLTTVSLAWEIPVSAVDASGDGPIGRFYIDASSGARLHYRNDKHECASPNCTLSAAAAARADSATPPPTTFTVMAWLHTGFSPASTPTNEPLIGVEVDVPGYDVYVTDANGQFTVNLSAPIQVTVKLDGIRTKLVQGSNAVIEQVTLQPGQNQTIQLGASNSSQNELAHTTTYYWVYEINELARSILGDTPELAIADEVQPSVNIPSSCNAYYIGNSINFYHAAGNCNNTASASVIAHEWGHGLDDRYGGISQTNGLSEGWGDICSIYLLDDPVIGHGFYTNGNGIRNGNNTRQYPTGNGPHAQGQSWMGFAWKFRNNLRGPLGTAQAIAISNDVVLGSIAGAANDQANAVIQVFIADDDDGNLTNGTPHYNELAAACNVHNLPYPPILAGYLDNATVLDTTTDQLVPRFVEVDAIPNSGSFAQVRLHYNDGTPRQRTMSPTGAPNRYRALLPGVLSPETVSYHFEATHATGPTFRLPESGEFSYLTLSNETLWFEDFENGGVGWTHGATLGADDWEIAAPTGASGWNWTDPNVAASGSLCAGNDLTGDGAYAPSASTWLRSPPIDCSGYTNVRLRLKRWASCDVGFLDSLQILVNGTPLYSSPQVPLLDTEWTTLDLGMVRAWDNPAVVLEFLQISDATMQFGGWAIDDVEVYTTHTGTAPTTTLSLLPEQAPRNSPLQLSIRTPAAQPFVWVLGNDPGPTLIAGVPPILVGGSYVSFFNYTDAQGQYTLPFTAPPWVPTTGTVWYSHALTIDGNNELVTTNQFINLFTF